MTTVTKLNGLLPAGYFVRFVAAEDSSVDDEYEVIDGNGMTGVAFQMDSNGPCVSYWDEDRLELRHWLPREWDQTAALRGDVLEALRISGGA